MSSIVVDDEQIARELLANYISKIPELELLGTCENSLMAMQYINKGIVDLLFLDIEMPEINGLDFLKSLKYDPKVILTTAYTEYALHGYELDVLDYLVKPIEFNRFYISVNKALSKSNNLSTSSGQSKSASQQGDEFFFVKSDNKVLKVNFDEIQYITSKGAYVQIVQTTGKKILTLQSMNRLEEILPGERFFRVHRSHIINIAHVHSIEGNFIRVGEDMKISLSKSKKDIFIQHIDKNNQQQGWSL